MRNRVKEVQRAEAEQSHHIEEMATIHMNTIESLAIAIDAKDQTTHGHVRRTQIYATQMGKLFKVTGPESRHSSQEPSSTTSESWRCRNTSSTSLAKLTEAEFAKMKIHPTVGGDILRRVNFPYPVEDIVRYHHEKWDGSGYPKGLKARSYSSRSQNHLGCRFLRCDSLRSSLSQRYEARRVAGTVDKMAGSAFDPRVVEMFTEHVEEFDTSHRR